MSDQDQEWCYEDSVGESGEEECPTNGNLTGHPALVTCKVCIERFNLRGGLSDPDFRQRMHFQGPPGFLGCTRPWPHEGSCAHPPEECRVTDPTRGPRGVISHDHEPEQEAVEERNLLYYDGPILDFRVCLTKDAEPMLEIVAENGMFYQHDDWQTRLRLGRGDLQVGLDMLDRHAAPPPGPHDGPMDVGVGYPEVCKKIEEASKIIQAWQAWYGELEESKEWYEKTYPDTYPPKEK